ncbi:DUF3027 domain-containing protein [Alloscardovia criceti]|uniref:DUF3027 domain-containing protein n=1 Tax=Alloscardovia criceti TaxID=356828 RepID=UPI0003A406A4
MEVEESTIVQARQALADIADDVQHIGDFVVALEVGEHLADFRFDSQIKGYEGWQWSVTMYHDIDAHKWTVNESSLIPTSQALLAPEWIPWKDRLEPSDISPTDVLGTPEDDERLEPGVQIAADEASEKSDEDNVAQARHQSQNDDKSDNEDSDTGTEGQTAEDAQKFRKTDAAAGQTEATQTSEKEEFQDIVEEFELARSRVLSPVGRAQAADRWYSGPHGPKSLSTRVASGKTCQTCGFFVQLQGELGTMFGVCANKWSQDDGRVVSMDHGCGEHSDIEPPTPSTMWVQPDPTVNDDDDIILITKPRNPKPTAEERRIADILEDVEDPEDLTDSSEESEDSQNAEDSIDTADTADSSNAPDHQDNPASAAEKSSEQDGDYATLEDDEAEDAAGDGASHKETSSKEATDEERSSEDTTSQEITAEQTSIDLRQDNLSSESTDDSEEDSVAPSASGTPQNHSEAEVAEKVESSESLEDSDTDTEDKETPETQE